MEKDLNLALKKDIFEGLKNGTTNEIVIEKTNWWKKRLMDLDTGRFKEFTTVVATCADSDKYRYNIESIELKDDNFVIVVSPIKNEEEEPTDIELPDEEIETESEQITEQVENQLKETFGEENVGNVSGELDGKTLEINTQVKIPNTVNEITEVIVVDKNEVELQDEDPEVKSEPEDNLLEQKEDYNVVETGEDVEKQETLYLKEQIGKIFDNFCKFDNVCIVNAPNVTIRNTGQILGCSKRLVADRDSDVRINFAKKEFIKYDSVKYADFMADILGFMKLVLKNNYVFVNKNLCGFRTTQDGNLVFYMTLVPKKKYLFSKK